MEWTWQLLAGRDAECQALEVRRDAGAPLPKTAGEGRCDGAAVLGLPGRGGCRFLRC